MSVYTLLSFLEGMTVDRIYGWGVFGVSAVAALALLIVVHEFGHFITARLVGVRVEKFSIGFGPKIAGWRRGDTEYMLSWIPLGGYVKFYGDDPEALPVEDAEDSFLSQAVWKRLMIVAAGPVSNIMLAIFIVAGAAMIGVPERPSTTIAEVKEDSPAALAGFLPGDTIEAIDGAAVDSWDQIRDTIHGLPGRELTVDVLRADGRRAALTVVPEEREVKTLEGETLVIGLIGVSPSPVIKSYPPGQAFVKGVEWTWDKTVLIVWSIYKLINRDIPADQIAGPIGIMQIAGEAASLGAVNLMMFLAIISINLGILNLLPIPILDGGHLVFFSVEALLGRPVQLKAQEIAQQVGLFLLISLMLFAFYNDIMRLVSG